MHTITEVVTVCGDFNNIRIVWILVAQISWRNFLRFATVAVAALIGISAGVYFNLPVLEPAPSTAPQLLEEEVLQL